MNPLLFANLGGQRRLLQSGSAYATERLVLNVLCAAAFVGNVVVVFVMFRLVGVSPFFAGGLPDDVVIMHRILVVVLGVVFAASTFLSCALVRAFLDIADASIAISLHGAEERSVPPAPGTTPGGRGDIGVWPEVPKPLIPEQPRPEDRKYMPGGR